MACPAIGETLDFWSEADAVEGCVLFTFADDLYAGFWATVRAARGDNPIGACCAGATCQITDKVGCRIEGGYFRAGVVGCFASTCGTGVCCIQAPACIDDDGAGGG